MKLFDCIKQLFSYGEFEEETAPTYKDDSEDQEICYIPPYEEPNYDEPSITDNSETNIDEASSIPKNNIDSISDKEDVVVNEAVLSSKLGNNSANETPSDEGMERIAQLQKNVISTIEEFDTYLSKIDNEDAKALIALFQHRLIESLVESGLDRIDDDKMYNCLRHVLVPYSIVTDGTPIREFKRYGIIQGNQVLLKAQVTV